MAEYRQIMLLLLEQRPYRQIEVMPTAHIVQLRGPAAFSMSSTSRTQLRLKLSPAKILIGSLLTGGRASLMSLFRSILTRSLRRGSGGRNHR